MSFPPSPSPHPIPSGLIIRASRILLGLTLRDLAASSDLHFSTLSRFERGERALSARALVRVANALGVPPVGGGVRR